MWKLLVACSTAFVLFSSYNELKNKKIKLPEEFVKIPGGSFSLQDREGLASGDSLKRTTIQGFYMSKYEVSNKQYRQFFAEVSVALGDEEKARIACDTLAWDQVFGMNSPMRKYYTNPAFEQYPVVNVSYEGAVKYCEWLEGKIRKDHPELEVAVRLPSRMQWIWAAMGGRSQAMYPWGTYQLRDRKGEPMCNFRKISDHAIFRNRTTGKPEIVDVIKPPQAMRFTTPVKSFYPNDYGLFNMCGNAAEIIEESGTSIGGSWNDFGGDIHIRSESRFDKPAPTVGFRPVILVSEKQTK